MEGVAGISAESVHSAAADDDDEHDGAPSPAAAAEREDDGSETEAPSPPGASGDAPQGGGLDNEPAVEAAAAEDAELLRLRGARRVADCAERAVPAR